MIAESLNIPRSVVLWSLKEDLGKRNLCARLVPHYLTPEQMEGGVTSCQDLIAMADADKNLFFLIFYIPPLFIPSVCVRPLVHL
jgi:hypothetical protein